MMEHQLDLDEVNSPQLSQDSPFGSNLSQEGELNPSSPARDKKKKKKKSRRHKKKEEGEGVDSKTSDINGNTEGVENSKHHSKKEKSERKSRKHHSKRPDPEGGNPPSMSNSSCVEFDRIINNSEPLFSDIELDISLEDIDTKPETKPTQQPYRPTRANRGGRGGGAGGLFFPSAQLGANNTMIKFAIIGTELKNVFQVSHRMESEAARLHERIKAVEENLLQSSDRIKDVTSTLKTAFSGDVGGNRPENEWSVGDRRLEELHNFVIHAAQVANVTEEKHKEALRKLVVIENELGKAEEKSRKAEAKVKRLEEELCRMTSGFVIVQDSQMLGSYQSVDDDKLDDLMEKLDQAEKEAEASEKEMVSLQKTVERMEFFLKHACDMYTKS